MIPLYNEVKPGQIFPPSKTITNFPVALVNDLIGKLNNQSSAGDIVVTGPDWGCVGDGVTNNDTALQRVADYIEELSDAGAELPRVVFPSGVYLFSTWPDFAFSYLTMVGLGEVRLRYDGTGDAITFDGSAQTPTGVRCLTFDSFMIEAPSTAQNGLVIKFINDSIFKANVRGCGTTSNAFEILSCVCSAFWLTCSHGDGPFYDGGTPAIGIYLDRVSAPLGQTSFCSFYNPVIEGVGYGIYCKHALGNLFFGGTSESNTNTGIFFDTESIDNKAIGMDFEANTTRDVLFSGNLNKLIDCDTGALVTFGAASSGCELRGGTHSSIVIASGAARTILNNFYYNQAVDGSVIADANDPTSTIRVGPIINWAVLVPENPPAATGFRFIGNTAATINPTDRVVSTSVALSAPRTWTLPPTGTVPPGTTITVMDFASAINGANTLTVACAAGDNFANGGTTKVLSTVLDSKSFISDGNIGWAALPTVTVS